MAKVHQELQNSGAALWAISPQDVAQNDTLRRRHALPYPILADADQRVIRAWGLFNADDPKERPIPYPATYLINNQRRVAWRHVGLTTRDRPTPGQIVSAVRAQKT